MQYVETKKYALPDTEWGTRRRIREDFFTHRFNAQDILRGNAVRVTSSFVDHTGTHRQTTWWEQRYDDKVRKFYTLHAIMRHGKRYTDFDGMR